MYISAMICITNYHPLELRNYIKLILYNKNNVTLGCLKSCSLCILTCELYRFHAQYILHL